MEFILHILGLCPDSMMHLDLRDAIVSIGPDYALNFLRLALDRLRIFFC